MSYATQAQADTALLSEPWISKTNEEKQSALDMGTLWIDDKYTCVADVIVQDNLVKANILLADKYVSNKMFEVKEGVITSKSVKGDTVETSKDYSEGTQNGVNPYAEIELLLGSVCTALSSMTLVSRRV